jgi:hypothetical protein
MILIDLSYILVFIYIISFIINLQLNFSPEKQKRLTRCKRLPCKHKQARYCIQQDGTVPVQWQGFQVGAMPAKVRCSNKAQVPGPVRSRQAAVGRTCWILKQRTPVHGPPPGRARPWVGGAPPSGRQHLADLHTRFRRWLLSTGRKTCSRVLIKIVKINKIGWFSI